MLYALKIATRYLTASKAQTALLVFGVAIGVFIFIFMSALIGGLAEFIMMRTAGDMAHITIQAEAVERSSFAAEVEAYNVRAGFHNRQLRFRANIRPSASGDIIQNHREIRCGISFRVVRPVSQKNRNGIRNTTPIVRPSWRWPHSHQ